MQIYLVGGAVRDELLGLPIKERDWVVVGATPEELLSQGYKPVGKDFPVFLHPQTHEEYALARTEKKVAPGYTGFVFHASPDVSLEEDLKRRDLTINAIAKEKSGKLIDPFHGQQDLKNKILRHVSPSFSEDPVRILRAARFAARFPDFVVADETLHLMQDMVKNGEVGALVPERVWQELQTALQEKAPIRFFDILNEAGALNSLIPEPSYHELALDALRNAPHDPILRFAILLHNVKNLKDLLKKLRAPSEWSELALLTQQYGCDFQNIENQLPEAILKLLQKIDAYRRPERFNKWLDACEAAIDHANLSKQKKILQHALLVTQSIKLTDEEYKKLTGMEIQGALFKERLKAISSLRV